LSLSGGSLQAVQNAIASGRITLIDGKVDPEIADVQWERRTDLVQQGRGASGGAGTPVQPAGEGERSTPPNGAQRGTYFDNKSRRELAEAQLSELELREKMGELVRKSDVSRETFTLYRTLRDRFEGVPDRVSSILAAEPDSEKVHSLLSAEIKTALREIADGLAGAAQ
jgi:hypothetical protein